MKIYALIIIFLVVSSLIYHISHELFHIIVGQKAVLKLVSVQWFGYHRGTKVTFENEEKICDENNRDIPKAWIYMSLAGIIGTTLTAYILVLVYMLLPSGYIRLFLWIMSAIFLVSNPGYSVLCSFFGNGDLYLVKRAMGRKKYILNIASVLLFIVNICIFIIISRK